MGLMAPSPFVQERKDGKKAFVVVVLFAAIAATAAVAGIYRAFIRNPVPFAATELTSTTPSLFSPPHQEQSPASNQPAKPQKAESAPAPIETPVSTDAAVPETKTVESDALPAASETPQSVAMEDEELEALRKARDAEIEKKIREIEALDAARQAREKAENAPEQLPAPVEKAPEQAPVPDPAPAAPEPPAVPAVSEPAVIAPQPAPAVPENVMPVPFFSAKKQNDANNKAVLEQLLGPTGQLRFAKTEDELPAPDLVQGNFSASLPNFGLIKPKGAPAGAPLHLIDPLPEMLEKNRHGMLPKKDSVGNTPLKAYAAPATPPLSPYIAFLLTGLGRRENVTKAAIGTMPSFVSLSFSPYSKNFETDIRDARQSGHETLIDLPMQHGSFPESDPGPLGLVAGFSEQDNRARLYKVMGRSVAYIGLTAQHNQNFSYYESAQMKEFVTDLDQRGLALVAGTDDRNMPVYRQTLRPDVYIADDMYRAAIRARLEKAKKIALEKGSAFVRIDAVPVSMVVMLEFINSFAVTEEGQIPEISFVPLSYYIEKARENKK